MNYHIFETKKSVNNWALWMGMYFPADDDEGGFNYHWKIDSSPYFRISP